MLLPKNRKIHFIVPYPEAAAPGQRFRFEQYFDLLKGHGYTNYVSPFFSIDDYKILYSNGKAFSKAASIVRGFIKRVLLIPALASADIVFIFREATPIGPPIFEWIIAKVLRKKIIYDFDDAIWQTDKTNEPWMEKKLRWRSKIASICKWSYKVSCGNEYICKYALQFNNQVVLNPTTIDTEKVHIPDLIQVTSLPQKLEKENESIIVGWTGSHSTLKYLEDLEPVLIQIEQKYAHISFLVISNKCPSLNLKNLIFKPWSKETEIKDLMLADIGIMPLPDDEWAKGKCGFKALQYMALEIPALVSPVGVNTKIVDNGINGYWCLSANDWMEAIEKLISNKDLRKNMGIAGRKKVIEHYSVSSNSSTFLGLFS